MYRCRLFAMKRIIIGIFALLNIVAVIALCSGATGGFSPTMLSRVENPKKAVEGFFGCLCSGEYEKSYSYINGYSSLGLESLGEEEDMVTAFMRKSLLESYDFQLINAQDVKDISGDVTAEDYSVRGRSATVRILFTVFDNSRFSEAISTYAAEAVEKSSRQGSVPQTDEEALALLEEAFGSIAHVPGSEYHSTVELEVNLTYTGGRWKIDITNELYAALMGNIPQEAASKPEVSDADAPAEGE